MFGYITDIKDHFGFLIGDGEEVERFFHRSVVTATSVPFADLEPNDKVEFIPVADQSGRPRAINVRCLAKAGDIVPGEPDGQEESSEEGREKGHAEA